MTILGIESSCDETSAAVMIDGELRSNVVSSQLFHHDYGGVVPELASRAHLRAIVPVVSQALQQARVREGDIQLAAATQGPGLIGALLVGMNFAKAFACARGIPFMPVDHIEAHVFAVFLERIGPSYPFLSLVVSGGHTLLMRVDSATRHEVIGSTIDDAAGEAFDKVAKMLGLGFPGGPEIDRRAASGNPNALRFPRPLLNSEGYSFSFSGLKTSVLYHLRSGHKSAPQKSAQLAEPELNDICASFQEAAVEVLCGKTLRAAGELKLRDIALAGGVSANKALRDRIQRLGHEKGHRVFLPSAQHTTDNAAMVANRAWMLVVAGAVPSKDTRSYSRMPGLRKHERP